MPCFKCGADVELAPTRKWLTPDEQKFIRDNYKKMAYRELSKVMGRHESVIGNYLHKNNLKLPKSEFKKRHDASLFKKGNISWNKGLSLPNVPNSGQFIKGSKPHNTKPAGHINLRNHKRTGEKYLYIKISDKNWKLLHHYNWELVNGPIPKKHLLRFKDGDTLNCNIENLELISKRENLMRNMPDVRPDRILFDRYIAARLKIKGKENQDYFIKEHPELIELKRQQLLLQRGIDETRRAS